MIQFGACSIGCEYICTYPYISVSVVLLLTSLVRVVSMNVMNVHLERIRDPHINKQVHLVNGCSSQCSKR